MRRFLPFLLLFLLIYIEVSVFVRVVDATGVLMALVLVFLMSALGVSLVRSQGIKTLFQMQQKMAAGENPAAEVIKSVSLLIAGFLLIFPGFFTDFLALLLILPPVQKLLAFKLLPHVHFRSASPYSSGESQGRTIEGEFERKDKEDNDNQNR